MLKVKIYEGPLSINKMNPIEKRAYKSWKDQYQRCNNPKNKGFKDWGARGIKRVYGSREFIGWYVEEYQTKGMDKVKSRVHVDRVDSDGNYEFGNVRLVSIYNNIKSRNERHGNPTPSMPIVSINTKTGERRQFPSVREASRELKIYRKCIQQMIRGTYNRKAQHSFKFEKLENSK